MKSERSVSRHRIGQWALTAFALFALSLPQAWGSVEENQKLLEFLDGFPAEMIPEESADSGTGSIQAAVGDGFAGAAESFGMDGVLVEFRERPAPEKLYPVITGASVSDGIVTIQFDVLDEFGTGVAGFQQGQNVAFSFTANKLVPGTGGKTDAWVSYIRGADEGVPDAQATTYNQGTFSAQGGGSYTFTFADPLASISGIDFEPALTHRFGVEVRSAVVSGQSVPGADTAFDIQPSTGATTGIRQREIIVQEDCAACHGSEEFAFHGGARQDVRQCVSCHQPGSFDVGSGNTIEFGVMIHKIHTGVNLTQKPYEFCGFGCEAFGAPPDDFSNVLYPQSTQNCVACHDPANPATPQAINVANAPTAETCASCHDGLSFDETGLTNERRGHPGLAQPNSTCAACHSDNGLMTNSIDAHYTFNTRQALARRFKVDILDVANTSEGDSPVVTFTIVDPTDGDRPYDLTSDPAFTGAATNVSMLFAWPTADYTNIANTAGTTTIGVVGGRAASISLVSSAGLRPYVTDNGDGTYTLDTFAAPTPLTIPAAAAPLGSGTVTIEGRAAADFDFDGVFSDRIPLANADRTFAINDATPQPRRQIVALESCQDCHGVSDGLAGFHGANRSGNTQVCSACHHPAATDIRVRPFDPDGVANNLNEAAVDLLESQIVDFKYLIHAIHAADMRENAYVVYAGGGPFDFSNVTYPKSPAECSACHLPGTYGLPLGDNVLATTSHTGSTRIAANDFAPSVAAAFNPTIDNKISPEAAVCASCHDSQVAIEHMSIRSDSFISFGNAYLQNPDPVGNPDTQAVIDAGQPQNCTFCHGPGRFVDVADAHR